MNYDIDFRFRRALAPEGLTTFETCLMAVNEAAEDCRKAGKRPGEDPAVLLLTHHLTWVTGGNDPALETQDPNLRQECLKRIDELKRNPAIVSLLRCGIDYKPDEIKTFRREGRRTMRQLAKAIGFEEGQFSLDYNAPHSAMAGDYILETPQLYLRLSPERWGSPALTYRHPQWKGPAPKLRHANAGELLDLAGFAQKIRRELNIAAGNRQITLI